MVEPYFRNDWVTLYHGDAVSILPSIDAAVMVTDPPYGINFASSQLGPYQGCRIRGDESTVSRDSVLAIWDKRPALVFGHWRNPIAHALQALVWDKGPGVGMGDLRIPWKPNFELIFVLGKKFVGRRTTGVLSGHRVVSWASKGRLHPNMKPVSLLRELIAKCPDGSVVDPFCGSGTTLVAAIREGRRAIGIEIEEKFCELTARQVESEGVSG